MFTLNLKGSFVLKVSLPSPLLGVDLCLAQILGKCCFKGIFQGFQVIGRRGGGGGEGLIYKQDFINIFNRLNADLSQHRNKLGQ